ncbi:predicted protein, partial [Nematostella vectensis]
NKRPVEHLILEGRRRDELRDEAIAELRDLLLNEEQQFIQEMEAKEETTLERQAKMRERARFLKEKREAERLQIVKEKYDQRWREECEELRSHLSRRHQDEVFSERSDQIRMKNEQKQREKDLEKMYADLWERDVKAKAQREEQEAMEQMERNRETLRVLQLQSEANAKQREEERRLKELEAEWLKEQNAMRAQEEEFLKQEKLRKQEAAKRARDVSIRLKNEKEAKEKQEELALDMKILEKLLDDTRNEAMEESQRKKELREENLRFMKYCEMNRKDEEDRERALEAHVNAEVEKQWAKKIEQYRIERAARKKLLDNVLQTRQLQMHERKQIAEAEAEAERAEKERMHKAWLEHERLERENQERIRQREAGHQRDLDMQIDYQNHLKERSKEDEREEFLLGKEAEREYQRKLKEALERPQIDKVHPARLLASYRSKSATN